MCKFLRFALIALAVLSLLIAGIGCSKSAMSTTTINPPTSSQPPTTTSLPPTTTATIPPGNTNTTPPPTTTTKPPPTTTSISTNQVIISGYSFAPFSITVEVGTKVTWINQDAVGHTVTCTDPSIFNSPIGAGATISITFTVPGTYDYYCTLHPEMVGKVIVK